MKKVFITIIAIFIAMITFAQPDPHKNGDDSTVGGEPIGSYAPVGGGAVLMTILVAGWATGKALKEKKRESNAF